MQPQGHGGMKITGNADTVTCDNENIGLIRWHTASNIKGMVDQETNF